MERGIRAVSTGTDDAKTPPVAIAVLIPPQSDAAPARRALRLLRARLGLELTVVPLVADDDLGDAVRRVLEGLHPRVVIAIGTDATFTAVAAALVDEPVALAMVPTAASPLCRQLGLPDDVEGACEHVARACRSGHSRAVDLLRLAGHVRVEDRVVCSRIVMGRIAELDAAPEGGPLARVRWGLVSLMRLFGHSTRFTIDVDGEPVSVRASSVIVANTGAVGLAGLQWARDVAIDDGVVDVLVIRSSTVLDYAALISGWIRGRSRRRQVMHLRARKRVALRASRPVAVRCDGATERLATLEALVAREGLRLATPELRPVLAPPDDPSPPLVPVAIPELRAS